MQHSIGSGSWIQYRATSAITFNYNVYVPHKNHDNQPTVYSHFTKSLAARQSARSNAPLKWPKIDGVGERAANLGSAN